MGDYSGVNVTDAGTLAALRHVTYPYGGYGHHGYGHHGGHGNFHGDGSAVNANVVANRDIGLSSSINQSTTDQFLSNQISRESNFQTQFNNAQTDALSSALDRQGRALSAQIDRGDDTLSRQIADNRFEDRINSLTALIVANDKALTAQLTALDKSSTDRDFDLQRQIADCCCKLEAGQARIIANQECARANAAEAESAALRVIVNQRQQQGQAA